MRDLPFLSTTTAALLIHGCPIFPCFGIARMTSTNGHVKDLRQVPIWRDELLLPISNRLLSINMSPQIRLLNTTRPQTLSAIRRIARLLRKNI